MDSRPPKFPDVPSILFQDEAFLVIDKPSGLAVHRGWSREFEKRFGQETGPIIQEALHKASWILPRIVAACSPYSKFPTTRGWAAKQHFGNLPDYANAEGSDIQQFASFDTEARLLIEGGETAKRLPSATSLWFQQVHQEIEKLRGVKYIPT